MVDVQVVKVLVIVGLFVFTLGLGLLPLLIVRCMQTQTARGISFHKQVGYRRTLSILSCFAAGVFLATCLLGLLPDVRRDLEMALDSLQMKTEFPVPEFAMVFGLFVVLTIEQIVLTVKERKPVQDENNECRAACSKTPLLSDDNGDHRGYNRSISSEHSISGISDEPIHDSLTRSFNRESSHDSHIHDDFVHQHSTLRSLLLLVAISLHSLFEGLAVGLQKDIESVIGLFTALLLHKGILSFSLGMNLIQSKLSRVAIIRSLALFGLSAPVGIGIGIGIIDLWDSKVSTLVQGILQGIACGTFLYITFFEVLPHEFNSCEIRLVKVLFLIIGFITVTGAVFLELKYG
ncbi:zinc transporter ZIP1-like [Pecten maximus]|uniref:zinc transporter ZIP1-like n=1 Tax=Pecten maximus TaxID=6579 RepID=UPI001458E662|nr:zinc transporter ZIP1-like [Pecten maximus]